MSFFYDLNKRMATLAAKQDAKQISEDVKASAPKSRLAESLDVAEAGYSAKAGRAGKDLGKPGKNFGKIAKSAGERYGSKAAGERVAGAVLNKLRHPKESVEQDGDVMDYLNDKLKDYDAEQTKEGNAFTGALKATPKGGKFKVAGKEFTDTSSLEEVGMTPKQKSFAKLAPPVDKITFADKIAGAKQEVDEMLGDVAAEAMKSAVKRMGEADVTGLGEEEMDEGYAEMDAWLKSREKEKGTGRFDKKKISTGTVYTRKPETFDDPETDPEATGGAPKRKGRPVGTKRAIGAKHSGRSKLASKDAIAEELPITDRGEYDQEGESAKHDIKTIVRHAQALHKILGDDDNLPEWVQSKLAKIEGMMIAVDEYMQNQDQEVSEKAPPGAKAERMVKHIKKSLSKDGNLSGKDKAIAYATTWKAKKAGKVEEESTDKEDIKAEKAGKKVAKDIEYDEGHKGKDDNKAEKAGKKVTKDIEYNDKKDKEEKVDETTTSGSVSTASAAPKASKGMQFGKGVYEGLSSKIENIIAESMNVTVNMSTDEQGQAQKSITVTATDEDADKLAELLKMAGLSGHSNQSASCSQCGEAPCGCAEVVDENSPDWPTNTEKLAAQPELRTYSGGLNGPKSTGQTTVPVVASQLRRTSTMEENVELERSLFKTWKNYKG